MYKQILFTKYDRLNNSDRNRNRNVKSDPINISGRLLITKNRRSGEGTKSYSVECISHLLSCRISALLLPK